MILRREILLYFAEGRGLPAPLLVGNRTPKTYVVFIVLAMLKKCLQYWMFTWRFAVWFRIVLTPPLNTRKLV